MKQLEETGLEDDLRKAAKRYRLLDSDRLAKEFYELENRTDLTQLEQFVKDELSDEIKQRTKV